MSGLGLRFPNLLPLPTAPPRLPVLFTSIIKGAALHVLSHLLITILLKKGYLLFIDDDRALERLRALPQITQQ